MKLVYGGIFVAIAFTYGAFISSPELRAYAANTIFSTDIVDGEVKTVDLASSSVTKAKLAGNSVDSGKIVDQSIGANDIGPDSVGASELKGVSKIIFAECSVASSINLGGGNFYIQPCIVSGADTDDQVIAASTRVMIASV